MHGGVTGKASDSLPMSIRTHGEKIGSYRLTLNSVLRSRLLSLTKADGLRLHVLDQRVHICLGQTEPGHPNLLVFLEQRQCDRIFVRNQFVRLGNDPGEPIAIPHVRYSQQVRSNLVAIADSVTCSTSGGEEVLPLVDVQVGGTRRGCCGIDRLVTDHLLDLERQEPCVIQG